MKKLTPKSFLFTRDHLSRNEITQYLAESLPDEQMDQIECHLIDCAMCMNTVEFVREHGFDPLDDVPIEHTPTVNPRSSAGTPRHSAGPTRRKRYLPYSAAALVLLFMMVGYFAFFRPSPDFGTLERGITENAAPLLELKTNFAGSSSALDGGIAAYKTEEFEEARDKFQQVPATDSENYALAQAYLADIAMRLDSENYQEAIRGFEEFRAAGHPDTDRVRGINWQLAKAYLKARKYDALESLLKEMNADPQQRAHEQAGSILDLLLTLKENGKLK